MTKLTPTNEQQLIVDNIAEGRNVAIQAGAGCSKTTTLKMAAEALPRTSILYVAFNKSTATEAKEKFPINVDCKTLHSVAWRAIVMGTNYRSKLKGFMDRRDMGREISVLNGEYAQVCADYYNYVQEIITGYCHSASLDIKKYAFGWAGYNQDIQEEGYTATVPVPVFISTLVNCVEEFWKAMIDVDNPTKITHDTYLKLFQMSNPQLGYDTIMLDECSDSNAITFAILLQQDCQKILVGDTYQSLYAFRGAVNAFNMVPEDYSRLELTTSFRFNQAVAHIANRVLQEGGYSFSTVGASTRTELETRAILVGKNVTLFKYLQIAANNGQKVRVLGDTKSLFSSLYTANNLKYKGDPYKRYDKTIGSFATWDDFVEAAETVGEFKKIISILESFPAIHEAITSIKQCLVKDVSEADFTIATLFKSKGLEWDEVTLDSELFALPKDYEGSLREWLLIGQKLEQIYVACTRARVQVNLPEEAYWIGE